MSKHRIPKAALIAASNRASVDEVARWQRSVAKMSDSEWEEALRVASEPAYPAPCPGWHRCEGPAAEAARRSFVAANGKPKKFPWCPCHPGRWLPAAVRENAACVAEYGDYTGARVRPAEGPVPPRAEGSGIAVKAVMRMLRSRPQSEPALTVGSPGKRAFVDEMRAWADGLSDEELEAAIREWWL